jgi:TRAP-type uncharacterized transport system substrate-binding protein
LARIDGPLPQALPGWRASGRVRRFAPPAEPSDDRAPLPCGPGPRGAARRGAAGASLLAAVLLVLALPAASADPEAEARGAGGADAAAGAPARPSPHFGPSPDARPRRLRFCAGTRTGNYTFAAERIAERAGSGAVELEVVTTPGAADNLRRLRAEECDLALSQGDVFDLHGAEDPDSVRGIVPFKRVYSEYVHILCPIASGLTSTAQFGPNTRLITGAEGSGTSETWRAFRAAVPRLDAVQRIPEPINLVAVNRVKDSRDTCMLFVSGLNSSDIQGANAMSVNTPDRRRAMRLIGVNEPVLRNVRGSDGRPMYRFEPIRARFGSYDNLIDPVRDPETQAARPGTVTVPVVDAIIFARAEVLGGLADRGSGLVQVVEDAGPSIWARVSPPVPQRAGAPPARR